MAKFGDVKSLLSGEGRDFLVRNNGDKVPVSELEGKIVAMYFMVPVTQPFPELTSTLAQIYEKLKEKGEKFEVVLVSLMDDEPSFAKNFSSMPWLAIPYWDKSREGLTRYFKRQKLPFIVIIGGDGKTIMNVDFAEIVEEHGVDAFEAFPFNQEKLDLLAEKARAKLEAQTLESLLVFGDLDFVLGKEDIKVPVKELVGKNILLYFSAQWCEPSDAFLPKLIEAYHKIKSKDDDAFEIIFISSDRDSDSFDEFYWDMPWLALPFGDERNKQLIRKFRTRGFLSLVAIAPTGRTVTVNAKQHLMRHGADAYPFSEDRIQELERQIEEMAKGWPEKVKHELHEEHELILVRHRFDRSKVYTRCMSYAHYGCDACKDMGANWSYRCKECNFDLHPKCALKGL